MSSSSIARGLTVLLGLTIVALLALLFVQGTRLEGWLEAQQSIAAKNRNSIELLERQLLALVSASHQREMLEAARPTIPDVAAIPRPVVVAPAESSGTPTAAPVIGLLDLGGPQVEKLSSELGGLESRIGNQALWPDTVESADLLRRDVVDLVGQVPPMLETSLLPRLNALRWNAYALELTVRGASASGTALGSISDEIDVALSAMPTERRLDVENKLTTVRDDVARRYEEFRKVEALSTAKKLIEGGGAPVEFDDALARLAEWAEAPSPDPQARDLQRKLETRVVNDLAAQSLRSLHQGLKQARRQPTPATRQIALGHLLDSAVAEHQSLLIRLAGETEKDEKTSKLSAELGKLAIDIEKEINSNTGSQDAEYAKKRQAYQRWALGQVNAFNTEFDKLSGYRVPKVLDTNDYQSISTAMTVYLVPISVGQLEPAVYRLFNDAFERGWKKLENEKNFQTEVAKQEALTSKRLP